MVGVGIFSPGNLVPKTSHVPHYTIAYAGSWVRLVIAWKDCVVDLDPKPVELDEKKDKKNGR